MRLPRAFDADAAAAMREVVWEALAAKGVRRDDPATWTSERPEHLQHLKAHPAFRAVGSERLLATIDALLEGQAYRAPRNWGAFLLAFPTQRPWEVPRAGWHCDANYLSTLSPPQGVRIHTLMGDVEPRCGGTLIVSGSHRLVHQWFEAHPQRQVRGADARTALRDHPYVRDLHEVSDPKVRIARFMESVEQVDGVPLQVVENTGAAGDVILLHPLVLHVAAPNAGKAPRFLLSGGVDTDAMWAHLAARAPSP